MDQKQILGMSRFQKPLFDGREQASRLDKAAATADEADRITISNEFDGVFHRHEFVNCHPVFASWT